MKKQTFLFLALFPAFAMAEPAPELSTEIDKQIKVAEPEKRSEILPHLFEQQTVPVRISREELEQNQPLTTQLLSQAIYSRDVDLIEKLLEVYQTFPEQDPILVLFAQGKIASLTEDYSTAIEKYRDILAQNPNLNPVRIELAIALFNQKQDRASQDQFNKAKTVEDLPEPVSELIESYLSALANRDGWNVDLAFNYLRDRNVNNVGNGREVQLENGGTLTRSDDMLPQSAHGFAYSFDVSRDFNVWGSNYLSVGNEFLGKSYWDNHQYDDISNRTFIGYTYKTAKQTLRVKPFYEKRWYGGESYRWANGVRFELTRWLNSNWQIATASEFAKQRYFAGQALNGNNKLISGTLVWMPNPRQFFYVGTDFSAERTQVRQYASDSKSLRLGWGQEWDLGISSRVGLSFTQREYKDIAKLANLNLLSFGKIREDKIYGVNLSLWKRDWHIWGITPKVVFSWRKQNSNIPEMYSYTQRNLNIVFEKTF